MRSALIHDWLISPVGGGEKVLEAIHRLFPSPIYTLVKSESQLRESYFADLEIRASFIQRFFRAEKKYKNYLPFFPLAIESFDLRGYDLILSSSHCAAKGVLTSADQIHICYCHTPMRYAWDLMHEYLEQSGLRFGVKGFLAQSLFHYLRGWDAHSAQRVDHFIANSSYVARRIEKCYGKQAHVIYPPVNVSLFEQETQKEDFYLAASRLVPYKRMDLIVEAFANMPDRKLVVIGEGPEWQKIKARQTKNIQLLGFQSDAVLKKYLQKAKALVFAAVEDFGIVPVEAMACGTPVIAFGKGGVCETVVSGETGLFYMEQSVGSLIRAVRLFENMAFDPAVCRLRAEGFSLDRFNREFDQFVKEKV